jgi:hypothetical protein
MANRGSLVYLPKRKWRVEGYVWCSSLRQRCYLVFTDDYFAWIPNLGAGFIPGFLLRKSFSVLPWSAIRYVEVNAVNYATMNLFFRVYWDSGGPEPDYFEIETPYLRRWTKGFLACGAALVGAENVLTPAGFWKENWPGIWFGILALSWLVITVFFKSFFLVGFVIVLLLNMGLWIVMLAVSKDNN